MANSLVKIDIHIIFHIKSTSIQMRQDDLSRIFTYIGGILKELGSVPIIVGGITNHIHILTTLPSNITLSDMMRTTKAKSCRWIKTLTPEYAAFAWQDGYGAFSVCPSILDKVINYIRNQEKHHRVKSFEDEYLSLLNAYQIPYDNNHIFND